MKYVPEVKSEVQEIYRAGKPRAQISEEKGIPLSTVSHWTRHIVSEPLSFITCEECGK